MSDVQITIAFPEALVARAHAVGLTIEDQAEAIAAAVEKEIRRREAGNRLLQIASELDELPDSLKPTPDEIVDIVRQIRKETPSSQKPQDSRTQ